ncbi:MAG: hypothetical protein ACD_11C00006G0006 [uncultured bacterium]|nr:MAG: hypothetical protein ACD_11C00006G0006 [uncultured bacterium]HBR71696.1 hypothetical protein [Candidatus Moranbacteria bacterium]
MGDFLSFIKQLLNKENGIAAVCKKHKVLLAIAILALIYIFFNSFPPINFYAQAYKGDFEKNQVSADFSFSKKKTEDNLAAVMENLGKGLKDENTQLEKQLYDIVGDSPIRKMVPEIAKNDRTVAAFIVGIAKKESNWGKRVPTLNGQDCYNYWGYKAPGTKGSAMGHGCFGSPEEAVSVVAKRIQQLVEKNLTTPSKMVVWKCGSSCASHSPESVRKWISDVDIYFEKILKI